eukprot:1948-Heterococcus_DN1.PRE.1
MTDVWLSVVNSEVLYSMPHISHYCYRLTAIAVSHSLWPGLSVSLRCRQHDSSFLSSHQQRQVRFINQNAMYADVKVVQGSSSSSYNYYYMLPHHDTVFATT